MFATAFIIGTNFAAVIILNLYEVIAPKCKKKKSHKIHPDNISARIRSNRYNKNFI